MKLEEQESRPADKEDDNEEDELESSPVDTTLDLSRAAAAIKLEPLEEINYEADENRYVRIKQELMGGDESLAEESSVKTANHNNNNNNNNNININNSVRRVSDNGLDASELEEREPEPETETEPEHEHEPEPETETETEVEVPEVPIDKENPLKCTACGEIFQNHFHLKTHHQSVHLKLHHKCNIDGCNAAFPSKRSRDRHSSNLNLHRKLLSTSDDHGLLHAPVMPATDPLLELMSLNLNNNKSGFHHSAMVGSSAGGAGGVNPAAVGSIQAEILARICAGAHAHGLNVPLCFEALQHRFAVGHGHASYPLIAGDGSPPSPRLFLSHGGGASPLLFAGLPRMPRFPQLTPHMLAASAGNTAAAAAAAAGMGGLSPFCRRTSSDSNSQHSITPPPKRSRSQSRSPDHCVHPAHAGDTTDITEDPGQRQSPDRIS
ncbi:GM12976 [Drosophila sechellia]|uniref:GM12976 n=2 Tax=Drosophila sechellia TaxID=7238 RepID=B4IL22_DROSE|nr:GM12976 [Drosophila sechellia]